MEYTKEAYENIALFYIRDNHVTCPLPHNKLDLEACEKAG